MKTDIKPLIWAVAVAVIFAFEYNRQNQEIQTYRPRTSKTAKLKKQNKPTAATSPSPKTKSIKRNLASTTPAPRENIQLREEIAAGQNRIKEAPIRLAAVFQKHPSQMKDMDKIQVRLEKSFSLNRTALKTRGGKDYTWIGKVDGQKSSLAVMTYMNGFFAGTFQTEQGLYTVEYNHRIQRYVMRKFDVYHHGNDAKESSAVGSFTAAAHVASAAFPASAKSMNQAADNAVAKVQVDVMFGYARDTYSSSSDENSVIAKIHNAIAFTNQMYENSQVHILLNLVHVFPVDYTGSGDMATDLTRWARNNDGYMDEIHSLRNQYAADLYSLVTDNRNSSVIGIAYYPGGSSQGSSSVTLDYIGTTVVGHEFGHNFGLSHETGSTPTYSYGRPHNFSSYYTVMWSSYRGSNQSIPYFSNPEVLYKGIPSGVTDQREEARALNNSAQRIADFKKGSATPIPTTTTLPITTTTRPPVTTTTLIVTTTTTRPPVTTTTLAPTTTTQASVRAPVARAGADQAKFVGDLVQLNGSQSTDPQRRSLSYRWQQTAGPRADLDGENSAQASFIAKEVGTYAFRLTVSNGILQSHDSVSITVSDITQLDDIELSVRSDQRRTGFVRYEVMVDASSAVLTTIKKVKYDLIWNDRIVGQRISLGAFRQFRVTFLSKHRYKVRATLYFKDGSQKIIFTDL